MAYQRQSTKRPAEEYTGYYQQEPNPYGQGPAHKQPKATGYPPAFAQPQYAQPQYAMAPPQAYTAPAEEVVTEVIWIPNAKTGRVIGKQGRQIMDFKAKSGTEINVGAEEAMVDGNRDVNIRGTRMGISFAAGMIRAKITDDEQEQEVTFNVPDKSAGYIIGKGGVSLKEIKTISGCMIKISGKGDSQGEFRSVTLSGSASAVAVARGLVEGRVQQTPDEGKYYQGHGGVFQALFQGQPLQLNVGGPGGGPPRAQAYAPQAYAAPVAYGAPAAYGGQGSPYGAPAASPFGAPAPMGAAALIVAFSPRGEEAATSTQEIYIPVAMVGRIIGKGGANIRMLKQQSGAEVSLAKADEQVGGAEGLQRKVTLTGTTVALILADGLMRSKMAESMDRESTESSMRIPNNRAGQVIGKQGATIRMIKETSGCQITMTSSDEMEEGSNERLISLTGTRSQNLLAEALILAKMAQADSHSMHA